MTVNGKYQNKEKSLDSAKTRTTAECKTLEHRHDKTCLREFPTRPDTNWPAQPQKLASLEILAIESRDIILAKKRTTKSLIRLRGCPG